MGRQPDFLIIGAQKAGTTSLHVYLSHHPQLCPGDEKELHFFDQNAHYRQRQAFYPPHFAQAEPGQLCYESTPNYFHQLLCAKRMATFNPNLKLIILLREPIARAYSAWYMYHKPLDTMVKPADPRSFTSAMEAALDGKDILAYLTIGKYAMHLKRLTTFFPREQLLILDFEQLVRAPEQVLKQCYAFLDISPLKLKIPFLAHNPGGYQAPPALPPMLLDRLQSYFQPHNQSLKSEWELHFPWLNHGHA